MKIKEAAALSGLTERTVRFYEEEGLIAPKKDYYNGRYYRDYSEGDIRELKTIAVLRGAGFTMDEIRQMQNEQGVIGRILEGYRLRLSEESVHVRLMSDLAATLEGDKIASVYDLAGIITEKAGKIDLPPSDIQLRFGRFDEESEAEKAAEYERFRKKLDQKRPELKTVLVWVFGVLSCLLAGILIVIGVQSRLAAPPTTGSTEGLTYRAERYSIYCTDADGKETLIFTYRTDGPLNVWEYPIYVGAEHIYVNMDETLFSLNADGSGYHLIRRNGGKTDSMVEYGSQLIFVAEEGGSFGNNYNIMYVPVAGGLCKKLVKNVDAFGGDDTSYFYIENNVLFAQRAVAGYVAVDLGTFKTRTLGRSDDDVKTIAEKYFRGEFS